MPADAVIHPWCAKSRHSGGGWYDSRPVARVLLAVGLVIGLASCSSNESSSGTTLPPMPLAQAFPKDLNASVAQRTILPDCGEYDSTVEATSGELSEGAAKAQSCFWAAYESGNAGELRVIAPQAGSSPKAEIMRVLAKGRYEIYTQYEDERWALQSCPAFIKRDARLPTCE